MTESVTSAKYEKRGIGALTLHSDKEWADLLNEMQDIHLAGNIPYAQLLGAAVARLVPIDPSPKLGHPLDDVRVGVDNAYRRVAVAFDDYAAFPEQQARKYAAVSVRFNEKCSGAEPTGPSYAQLFETVANGVSVYRQARRDLIGAGSCAVQRADLILTPRKRTGANSGTNLDTVVMEQCPNRGGTALVLRRKLIQAGPGQVSGDDRVGVIVKATADTRAKGHIASIKATSDTKCTAAGVPFLFKQFGEYAPNRRSIRGYADVRDIYVQRDGTFDLLANSFTESDPIGVMRRVGKKAAGRDLDGREWSEYPA